MSSSTVNHTDSAPSCTIIIPTRDQLHYLKNCVEGVLSSTVALAVELIIVDNESEEDATRQYLQEIAQHNNVRVLQWQEPFNFSAINNYAVEHCDSDLICFLNNDIEILDEGWLEKMAALAMGDNVGAVGCLLLYPDQRVQHAGVALDEDSIAKHIGLQEAASFLQEQNIKQPFTVPAVTAACMMMRRSVFVAHGGFDADNLAVAYNDVDLCLKLGTAGLSIMLHPEVLHVHHESVSRQSDELDINRPRALAEFNHMKQRWQNLLQGKHYESGLPASVQTQLADTSDATQSHGTRLETLQGKQSSADTRKGVVTGDYRQLEQQYQELLAHSKRIEEAHRLIEHSIFWRMTAPLRTLRGLFSGKPTTSTGTVQNSDNSEQSLAATTGPKKTAVSVKDPKADHDSWAEKQLQTFLASESRLTFPQADNPDISILLVFYNRAPLSYLCLQSILEHADVSYEVIIVDNQSTDNTDALLATLDKVRILRNEENLGFVKAVNQGAQQARGKHLLLLNNDAQLEANSLSAAMSTLESSTDIGAVGGKIKLLDGSLQEAGSIIWRDGACLGYGRHADPEAGEFMFRRDVDYCSGAFLMFSRELFQALDGFDEVFAPAYYEESDFCIRIQEKGLRVVYEPRAVITHYEFASSGGLSGASKLQQRHREILCDKHAGFLGKQQVNDNNKALFARTANKLPNVLIIDDRIPYPSLGAGYPRCCHILNTLAEMPVNITFYPLLFPSDDWQKLYEILPAEIEVILGEGQAGLAEFLQTRTGFYDTIMVSRVHNMEIFNNIVGKRTELNKGARIVYDAEAITAPREVLRRRLWGESVSDTEESELITEELKQAKDSNSVLAVSEQEAELYRAQGIENTVVLGHTMQVKATAPGFDQRSGLLFVGALRDEGSPNVDSLLWFLINCLPLIEEKIPDIRLYVVGDSSAPSLTTINKDNVLFMGRLDSIADIYDQCRVFLAPTRFAAGIPHKIHEAAGNGLPSVATSLLARQLGWNEGAELLVADAVEDYANQCIKLHTDKAMWQAVQKQGQAAVSRDCSDVNFRQSLAKAFQLDT